MPYGPCLALFRGETEEILPLWNYDKEKKDNTRRAKETPSNAVFNCCVLGFHWPCLFTEAGCYHRSTVEIAYDAHRIAVGYHRKILGNRRNAVRKPQENHDETKWKPEEHNWKTRGNKHRKAAGMPTKYQGLPFLQRHLTLMHAATHPSPIWPWKQ